MSGADLRHSDLRGADLSYANLSNADISHTLIETANFTGANLRSLFTSDLDLHRVQLENAIMPDGARYGQEVVTTIR